jgi:DNA-binding SARP family transcriptional activator
MSEFGDAAKQFERLVELAPDDADAWFSLADCRYELDYANGALEAARKCKSLLPPEPDPEQRAQIDELIAKCQASSAK